MKTISICGSMLSHQKFDEVSRQLESLGFRVLIPNNEGTDTDYDHMSDKDRAEIKNSFIDKHIIKIRQSDAVLVINPPKNNIDHYIGANTFLEMGFAYVLKKPIFILYEIPQQPNNLEIVGLKPIILSGKLMNLVKNL